MVMGPIFWRRTGDTTASSAPGSLLSKALQQLADGTQCISLRYQPSSNERAEINDASVSVFTKAMVGNTTLTSLELDRNKLGDLAATALAATLATNHSLKSLDLDFNQIGDAGMCSIAGALKVNGGLHQLEMHGNSVGCFGAEQLSEALQVNTCLRTLSLDGNPLGNRGAFAIADALGRNCTLRILSLHSCGVGYSATSRLAWSLERNTGSALQELSLGKNLIGDAGAARIAQMLKVNSKLHELRLEGNNICDVGALQLAKALEVNRYLRELWLLDNCISKEGVKHFSRALNRNSTLMRLSITAVVKKDTVMDDEIKDLQDNHQVRRAIKGAEEGNARLDLPDSKLGDSGAIKVAEMIEKSHTLLGLNLAHCGIGDQGAARLAKALETNASILEVSLAGNAIGAEGAQRLMDVLQQNQTIYDMDLGGNPLGGHIQRELAANTESRLTFGHFSCDSDEKRPEASPCHATFSTRSEGGHRPRLPMFSGQPSPALRTWSMQPSAEGEQGERDIEEGASTADEVERLDERGHIVPDESEHGSCTEIDSVTETDDTKSDLSSDETPSHFHIISVKGDIVKALV